jgi:hypothetical protein
MTTSSNTPENDQAAAGEPGAVSSVQHRATHPAGSYTQSSYPQHVHAQPSHSKGKSIASMVLGIVAVFFGYTFIIPIIGLILGITGIRNEPAGRGMAIAGIVLNGIVLSSWGILITVFLITGGIGIAGTAGTN